jgi:hypothetical protein
MEQAGAAAGIQEFAAPRFILVSDLDHTMVRPGAQA